MASMLRPILALAAWSIAAGCSSGSSGPVADSGTSDRGPNGEGGGARGVQLRPLPAPRQETAVVELGGSIYVIGGFDQSLAIVRTVERYDPAADNWFPVAPLPREMHHA